MTAFALIDRDHQVVRSTDGFRALSLDIAAVCAGSPDLESVLAGTLQSAQMVLGDTSLEVTAVTDAAGVPHALASVPVEAWSDHGDAAPETDAWVGRLRDALKESPALAWMKDPSGRHLYVNRRFSEALRVSEDQVLGRTDDELSPGETVDGPRRSIVQEGVPEPLELEYTVPAFAERSPFAAVRFAIRDRGGEVVGTCGLAAPLEEARMVRDEAGRVLSAERQRGMSPTAVRDDLLQEWGVIPRSDQPAEGFTPAPDFVTERTDCSPAPGPPAIAMPDLEAEAPPLPAAQPVDLTQRWDECLQHLQDEARRWQDEVAQSRSLIEQAQEQARQAVSDRDELSRDLATERGRNDELVRTIEQLRRQIADVGRTLEHAFPSPAEDPPSTGPPESFSGPAGY